MTEHPITPPPELVGEWLCDDGYPWDPSENVTVTITTNRLDNVATKAARWGADQELEACKQVILKQKWFAAPGFRLDQLHNARRPKPLSLKQQALEALRRAEEGWRPIPDDCDTIRRALEQLDD